MKHKLDHYSFAETHLMALHSLQKKYSNRLRLLRSGLHLQLPAQAFQPQWADLLMGPVMPSLLILKPLPSSPLSPTTRLYKLPISLGINGHSCLPIATHLLKPRASTCTSFPIPALSQGAEVHCLSISFSVCPPATRMKAL